MNEGSIRQIDSGKPELLAFEVNGKIRKRDIEAMARTVKDAFAMPGKIDIIIVMTDYDGIEFGAAFDAEGLTAQAQSVSQLRRYAVVGAPGWAEAMINLLSPLTPVEERTFDLDEADQAWAWVRA
jgi:hypothetical protein